MKKLREYLAMLSALVRQEAELQAAERRAAAEIEEAVRSGDHNSDSAMQKLSNAQLRKTLIPARRKKLQSEIAKSEEGLKAVYGQARQLWDAFVTERKEEIFRNFLDAVDPFFGGAPKAELTRREFEAMHIPARDALNRAFSPDFYSATATTEDRISWAEFLIAHAEKCSNAFGWESPDKIGPRTKAVQLSAYIAPTPPKKVKVRALQTVALPSLGPQMDNMGKPVKPVKAGTELEIDETQYRALSRFFERI
jgi:hypothetical protein